MSSDENIPDRDAPLGHHTPPGEVIQKSNEGSAQHRVECPLCGTPAEIIYGFGDGPQRGRLQCLSCGTVDWPPRAC